MVFICVVLQYSCLQHLFYVLCKEVNSFADIFSLRCRLEALATSAGKLLQYLDTETSIEAENQHKNAFMLQLLSAAKRDDDMEAIAQRTCISNAVLCGVLNISNLSTENMESGVDMRRILNTANFAVMLISGLSDESISPDVSHNAILDSVKILCACSSETNEYQTLNEVNYECYL